MIKETISQIENQDDLKMQSSARLLVKEGALASALFSLGTGNFLAGYLAYLGADAAFCAVIAALPQLGCAFELVSPFLFERLKHRKPVIIACCFFFRMSLPLAMLSPVFLGENNSRLVFVFIIYMLGFFAAGFVSPGLNRWVMDIAPEKGRGAYFAKKDIVSSIFNAAISLILGRWVDYNIKAETPFVGFLTLALVCLALSIIDFLMMLRLQENPTEMLSSLNIKDLLLPLKDDNFRPYIVLMMSWSFSQGLCASFLPAHMVTTLGLSHTYITGIGILSTICGMCGIWLWGRLADRKNWQRVLALTGICVASVYFLWGFVSKEIALVAAVILQCAMSVCLGAFNTSSLNIQYLKSPKAGKTIYIGVAAALFNLAYFVAAMLAAVLVSFAPSVGGIGMVRILLVISGLFMLVVIKVNKRAFI